MFDLNGKRVAVFGGSSGIGYAIARLSAELGAEVTIASRSAERLEAASAEIGCAAMSVNTTEPSSIQNFFNKHGAFDHIVVSAAQLETGPLLKTSLEVSRAAMDSKFWSAVHVARESKFKPGGSLTLVSGILTVRPSPMATLLGAINAALDNLAQGLALELAPIRVNSVSPGRLDTEWWDFLPDDRRKALLDTTAAGLPVKRIGHAGDIAMQVATFMLNGYMTGSVVAVDGGGSIA